MNNKSISKALKSYVGSDVISAITSCAQELGLDTNDVTVEFYDNIDGTMIEVSPKKGIENERNELA